MLFVVQTPYADGDIKGVFSSFEEAKNVADMITDKHNEFAVVYEFTLDVMDNRHIKDKIIYKTTIQTSVGPGGLTVYKTK